MEEQLAVLAEISESLSKIARALTKISDATWRNPDGDTVINIERKDYKSERWGK